MRRLISLMFIAALLMCIPARADEHDERCRSNLEYLGDAIKAYKLVHQGRSPAKLSDLYYEGYADDVSRYRCPGAQGGRLQRTEIDEKSDYTIEPLPGRADVLVRERKPNGGGNTVMAAMSDGSIKALSVSGGAEKPSVGDGAIAKKPGSPVVTTRPSGGEVDGPTVAKRDEPIATRPAKAGDDAIGVAGGDGAVVTLQPIDGDLDVIIVPRGERQPKITGDNLEDTPGRDRATGSVTRSGPGSPGGIGLSAADMIALADMISEKGGYDAALDQYERALEADPTNEKALLGHGRASMHTGALRLARMRFATVLKTNPTHPEARRLHATADLMLGNTQAAVEVASKLHQEFPNDQKVALLHAQAALYSGDQAAASARFAALTKAQPKLSEEFEQLADGYLADRLFNLALLYYRSAYELDPKNEVCQLNTAEVAAKLGQKKLAIDNYRAFLGRHPNDENAEYIKAQLEKLRQK